MISQTMTEPEEAAGISVDASHNGKEIEVPVGQSLIINLESNPSTGFGWTLMDITDQIVLNETSNKFVSPEQSDPPKVGVSGTEVWQFRALKPGKSTVTMGYGRSWESVAPAETFILTVNVVSENPIGISVDGSHNGKEIEVPVGQSLIINLESNPSTGFGWSIREITDQAVLNETSNRFVSPDQTDPPKVGVGGTEVWQFGALKPGKSTITMVYSRIWESVPPAETFVLTVNVVG